jgi:hypothetical protein
VRKRASQRGQTTDAEWKRAADRARLGDGAVWAAASTRASMRPITIASVSAWWKGLIGRAAANGGGGLRALAGGGVAALVGGMPVASA